MSAKLVTYYRLDRSNLILQTMRKLLNSHFAQLLFVQEPGCDVAMLAHQSSIAVRTPNDEPARHYVGREFELGFRLQHEECKMGWQESPPTNQPSENCRVTADADAAGVGREKYHRIIGRIGQKRLADEAESPASKTSYNNKQGGDEARLRRSARQSEEWLEIVEPRTHSISLGMNRWESVISATYA